MSNYLHVYNHELNRAEQTDIPKRNIRTWKQEIVTEHFEVVEKEDGIFQVGVSSSIVHYLNSLLPENLIKDFKKIYECRLEAEMIAWRLQSFYYDERAKNKIKMNREEDVSQLPTAFEFDDAFNVVLKENMGASISDILKHIIEQFGKIYKIEEELKHVLLIVENHFERDPITLAFNTINDRSKTIEMHSIYKWPVIDIHMIIQNCKEILQRIENIKRRVDLYKYQDTYS